ncbi:MAG: heavy metal translocating P-type ATPase, partial [Desulfovibrionaceae bacterium]|nr:heavy metal translocating P-type ATPase [Desulfovibrionaceae bacterium]
MQKFKITGMSCAACSARVEKAVKELSEVESCQVSLLTNTLGVEGEVDPEKIIEAVTKAGYGASLFGAKRLEKQNREEKGETSILSEVEDLLIDQATPLLKARLSKSLILLLPLLYFSMGHLHFGWPLPDFFKGNFMLQGLVQMLIALGIMILNKQFFINGLKGLKNKSPNMDTLVGLGSAAAFGWSVVELLAMTRALADANLSLASHYGHDLYCASAAMIVTLITVGKMLEARSKGKTTQALKSLLKLVPKKALLWQNGREVEVPLSEVRPHDIFIVKPGASIPVDGKVMEGESSINLSMLTGESIPEDVKAGDLVRAGTLNLQGYLRCEALRVGEETTLAQIIQLVSEAQATKAPVAKVADYVAGIFVPCVLGLALLTVVIWLLGGEDLGFALARGIAVLVISCPCALGLATPVAIMVGSGVGAKNGILFKNAEALEQIGKLQVVALDKTGTLTQGQPKVLDVCPLGNISRQELLEWAFSLEAKSEHPLAKAIVEKCVQEKIKNLEVRDFKNISGLGVMGSLEVKELAIGKKDFIYEKIASGNLGEDIAKRLESEGKTLLFLAYEGKLAGIIACADTLKEDSVEAVKELRHLGLKVVLLTGDNQVSAKAIARECGVDQVVSGVLPQGKEKVIRELKALGKVAMVGDGINDAPALSRADLGIAIGAGSDVALDAAQVILMKNSLRDVAAAIRLGRATLKNIKENLFWAFCYNVIGIPIAAGLFYPLLGLKLSPTLGALAMSLSSVCVVTNALRLNLCDPHKLTSKERLEEKAAQEVQEIKQIALKEEEPRDLESKIKVSGMMCGHCEARVREALLKISGITEVQADHAKGQVSFRYLGKLSQDDRTNALIIKDTADTLEKIIKIIELLDVQTPQVLIEAKIVEV